MSFLGIMIVSFTAFLLMIVAMALGVIFGRPAIKGSCGGLGSAGACQACSGQCRKADSANRRAARMPPGKALR